MDQIQQVINLLSGGKSVEAISIITNLKSLPSVPRLTYLLLAVALESLPFKFLAFRAATKELALHQSPEASTLLSNLSLQSEQGRQKYINGLPRISLIGLVNNDNFDEWQDCLDSLAFQHYTNVELCLICKNYPDKKHPIDIKFFSYSGSVLDDYKNVINLCSGDIVSIIQNPSTIFSDTGLGVVATNFNTDNKINIIQTEKLYESPDGLPSPMFHNFPHWDQSSLLNTSNLQEPTCHFSWQAVFFRKSIIKNYLPFCPDFPNSPAFEVATRIARDYDFNIGRYSVLLTKIPTKFKSPILSLKEISESIMIIDREKKLFSSPRLSKPQEEQIDHIDPSLPNHLPSIILKNDISNLKISIVTASYNCAEYIEACIDSILSQNYNNLEFLILDGGSTDGTKEKILRFEKYLHYFISKPDAGHYAAIQTGLNMSTGQVQSWLNADDMLCPYSLQLVSNIFNSRPDINWISGRPTNINKLKKLSIHDSVITYSGKRYLDGEFDNPHIQQEGTFWTKSLWQKAGSTLDLRLSLAADMELWTRFFQSEPLYSLNVPLGIFRERPGQRSSIYRQEYYCEAAETINQIKAMGAKAVDIEGLNLVLEF